ncbi:hypothetical protein LOC71_19105 [Rhodopirellula sp. JC740]|uniref:Uncharacterized protein n=1 Tax=Rhodopirellula halodulae TaxID=2894198 RepID=A0ABS8NLE0_9BACT|nr:hypothetical protein [Rhodopirellula sp. JC740]MCC9644386.1 hypothetical protein [Rhodopirellula sp. JC740]
MLWNKARSGSDLMGEKRGLALVVVTAYHHRQARPDLRLIDASPRVGQVSPDDPADALEPSEVWSGFDRWKAWFGVGGCDGVSPSSGGA